MTFEHPSRHRPKAPRRGFTIRVAVLMAVIGIALSFRALLTAGPLTEPLRFELFMMSHCPFSAEAVQAILSWEETFGERMEIEIFFIAQEIGETDESRFAEWGDSGPGLLPSPGTCVDMPSFSPPGKESRFVSLHGAAEVEEDQRQFVLQTYFPDLFFAYLRAYYENIPDTGWREACNSLGLSPEAIEILRSDPHTLDQFAWNIEHARSLGIRASPTLLINGERFPFPINHWSLGRYLCELGVIDATECAQIPVCGSDLECTREGFVGECVNPDSASAECVFTRPAEITLTFLRADECDICESTPVIKAVKQFLPRLTVREIPADSERGRRLIEESNIKEAPTYLLPNELKGFPRFETLRVLLRPLPEGFMVDPEWLSSLVLIRRERTVDRIDLIAGSLSLQAALVRRWFRENLPSVPVNERPYLARDPGADEEVLILQPAEDGTWTLQPARIPAFRSPRGEIEVEENLFQLAVLKTSREEFPSYRTCVDEQILSGRDYTVCRDLIMAATGALAMTRIEREILQKSETQWVEKLGLEIGSFALLIDNRILVRDFDEGIRDWLAARFGGSGNESFHSGDDNPTEDDLLTEDENQESGDRGHDQ